MNPHLKRKIRKVLSPFRKIGLKNNNFSILSNNCWGGIIYDIFGMKYLTPTIGCFFMSEDYIRFISNLEYYLSLECKEIKLEETKYAHLEKLKKTPIGIIDDIVIFFVHYDTAKDAVEKWNKRKKRVNFDNLLVKYNDQNNFLPEHYEKFKKTNYQHKIFITAKEEYKNDENVCFLKQFKSEGYAVDDIKSSFRVLKLKELLNNLEEK